MAPCAQDSISNQRARECNVADYKTSHRSIGWYACVMEIRVIDPLFTPFISSFNASYYSSSDLYSVTSAAHYCYILITERVLR